MTLHAIVDNEELDQVATIQGWQDFSDWADLQGTPELTHLVEHGFSNKLAALAKEIKTGLKKSRPDPDTESVAQGILDICLAYKNAKVLTISDGEGNDDDEDDEDGEYDDWDED